MVLGGCQDFLSVFSDLDSSSVSVVDENDEDDQPSSSSRLGSQQSGAVVERVTRSRATPVKTSGTRDAFAIGHTFFIYLFYIILNVKSCHVLY